MATWSRHVMLLVIPSNVILLSSLIALTYYLIPDGSLFWYTKSHSSIIRNWCPYTALLKKVSAAIFFIGKCSLHYPTTVLISIHQHLIYWDAVFLDLILFGFELPFIALHLQVDDTVIDPFLSQVGCLRYDRKASLIHIKL